VIVTGDLTHDADSSDEHAKRLKLFKEISSRIGGAQIKVDTFELAHDRTVGSQARFPRSKVGVTTRIYTSVKSERLWTARSGKLLRRRIVETSTQGTKRNLSTNFRGEHFPVWAGAHVSKSRFLKQAPLRRYSSVGTSSSGASLFALFTRDEAGFRTRIVVRSRHQ
jgi:hypothetical protein